MATDFDIKREIEILRLLKIFKNLKFVVVGGYAVDAYTVHRFSIDLDLIIREKSAGKFGRLLKKEGYRKSGSKEGFDSAYSGKFMRFEKNQVAVDFLINSLVCRGTGASWSFENVFGNSKKMLVKGLTESVEARVPEKEMLVAMKVHSGRITDLRDIVMLCEELDNEKIWEFSNKGNKTAVKAAVEKYIDLLGNKNFINSLKGIFSISGKQGKIDISEMQMNRARKLLMFLKEKLHSDSI